MEVKLVVPVSVHGASSPNTFADIIDPSACSPGLVPLTLSVVQSVHKDGMFVGFPMQSIILW
jgi:hypothetical protein